MGSRDNADLTGLLQAWNRGDTDALEQLAPLLQADLRVLARSVASAPGTAGSRPS
ncbi:MAG TPA: hypothetical protein VI485_30860 [Vicinamibacterales bacterium]|nr:hypothetical protein [Vicinamibacterales bacterium]